jgi:hypothetical protein
LKFPYHPRWGPWVTMLSSWRLKRNKNVPLRIPLSIPAMWSSRWIPALGPGVWACAQGTPRDGNRASHCIFPQGLTMSRLLGLTSKVSPHRWPGASNVSTAAVHILESRVNNHHRGLNPYRS